MSLDTCHPFRWEEASRLAQENLSPRKYGEEGYGEDPGHIAMANKVGLELEERK